MAAGFSYGGWTALSLGGVTGNHAGIVSACQDNPKMEACEMFLSKRINMQGLNADIWNASYADQRITHVTAIDPGFVWGLNKENTQAAIKNITLIGFVDEKTRMQATDFEAGGLTEL